MESLCEKVGKQTVYTSNIQKKKKKLERLLESMLLMNDESYVCVCVCVFFFFFNIIVLMLLGWLYIYIYICQVGQGSEY